MTYCEAFPILAVMLPEQPFAVAETKIGVLSTGVVSSETNPSAVPFFPSFSPSCIFPGFFCFLGFFSLKLPYAKSNLEVSSHSILE